MERPVSCWVARPEARRRAWWPDLLVILCLPCRPPRPSLGASGRATTNIFRNKWGKYLANCVAPAIMAAAIDRGGHSIAYRGASHARRSPLQSTVSFYAGRAAGRDCHHRATDRAFAAGGSGGPRNGTPRPVHEPSAQPRAGDATIRSCAKSISTGGARPRWCGSQCRTAAGCPTQWDFILASAF
jgi:hypothetical protein